MIVLYTYRHAGGTEQPPLLLFRSSGSNQSSTHGLGLSMHAVLQDLLADSNPMVVANAVAALAEIHEVSGKDVFQSTSQSLFKLLRALNECTEWGQVCT